MAISSFIAVCIITISLILGLSFSYNFFFNKTENQSFLKKKVPQFVPSFYSVHIVTWNVAGKSPNEAGDLLPLLGINSTFQPDFIAVGIQETVVAKVSLNFLVHNSEWPFAIENQVLPYKYELAGKIQNRAMDLIVFVKSDHAKKLEQFEKMEKSASVFSMIFKHKGGISLRFDLNWKSIVFTNSHLIAGDENNNKRERLYDEIKDKRFDYSGYFSDHDYHFWFGDLNFRLDTTSDNAMIFINSIKESLDIESRNKDIKILLSKDQLKISQASGRSFTEYKEPEITFLPSYKFFEYSDIYNLERTPSYCDRVLYRKVDKINNNIEIKEIEYNINYNYNISDHRPVTATFLIKA